MFKYISQILSQFTKTQRVIALLMLLTSITIITIGPKLIDSITLDRKELEEKITKQKTRIKYLEKKTKKMKTVNKMTTDKAFVYVACCATWHAVH